MAPKEVMNPISAKFEWALSLIDAHTRWQFFHKIARKLKLICGNKLTVALNKKLEYKPSISTEIHL